MLSVNLYSPNPRTGFNRFFLAYPMAFAYLYARLDLAFLYLEPQCFSKVRTSKPMILILDRNQAL